MLKLNNKGFAISTMLYGLLVLVLLLVTLLMNTLSFTRRNSSEFVENIRKKLETSEISFTKTYTGLNGLKVIKNFGQENQEDANIHAKRFLVEPGARQYGPYDKTIVAGNYSVKYEGTNLDKISNHDDINCYENDKVDTCNISDISISNTSISYTATITEDANYNGIEFSIMNNSEQGVFVDSITIKKKN